MNIVYAITTLAGTIIGVGLFSLPYITLKVGFEVILIYFIVLGCAVTLVHLFLGELALKTADFKRLPSFSKIYLGKWGERISYVSNIFGSFGALLAYLIVGGEFLTELFSPYFGGNTFFYTIVYFIAGAILIFLGTKFIAKIEFWGLIFFLVILTVLFFISKDIININNLFLGSFSSKKNFSDLFLPYGVILFSLWGAALIPEIEEMLFPRKRFLKWVIPISIIIPAIVYLFFIYVVLGVSGEKTTESALGGLKNILGNGIVNLALFFGILTTFTSFIAIGLTLKKIFWYDLNIKKFFSWTITCFIPLFLYIIGFKNFINVISAVGGIMLSVDGILILLMYNKIRPDRKFIVYPLILLFLLGIIYSIIYFSH